MVTPRHARQERKAVLQKAHMLSKSPVYDFASHIDLGVNLLQIQTHCLRR
jgi:hypothetical protein